jgi:C-terminal processing protease CtpA/Prc
VRQQRVAAVTAADTVPRPTNRNDPVLSLRVDTLMAVLRIATFSADDFAARRLEFDSMIDSAFATVRRRGVQNLVIDLRGNDGGRDTYGAHLLAHLMPDSFAYYRELTTRAESVSFHRLTLNLDSAFNRRFASGLQPRPDGRFRFPESRHTNLRIQQPHAPSFAGRVWVLVDGGTNSTSAEFTAVARALHRVRVLGQESAGVQEGNTSGSFAILVLPTSRLRIVLPLVRYELAVNRPPSAGRGVAPDISMMPTADDVIGRSDTVLQAAIREMQRR